MESDPSKENLKKKYKVGIEMEGWGKDGTEINGTDLYEEVVVEANSPEEAEDIAANMDFGNRSVGFVEKSELVEEKKDN